MSVQSPVSSARTHSQACLRGAQNSADAGKAAQTRRSLSGNQVGPCPRPTCHRQAGHGQSTDPPTKADNSCATKPDSSICCQHFRKLVRSLGITTSSRQGSARAPDAPPGPRPFKMISVQQGSHPHTLIWTPIAIISDRRPRSRSSPGSSAAARRRSSMRCSSTPGWPRTAVLVNEFGEIGIDHLLVEALDDDILLLAAGCLCCTIREDMAASLRSLFERRAGGQVPEFRRVVVETTGLADPAPILHTLLAADPEPAYWVVDGIVTTVDAVNGHGSSPHTPNRQAGRSRRPASDHQGRHCATAGVRRPARATSSHQPRSASPGGMPRRRRAGRAVRCGSVFPEQRPASGREPLAGRGRDRAPPSPSPSPCGRPR